jgi:hypothetical protein
MVGQAFQPDLAVTIETARKHTMRWLVATALGTVLTVCLCGCRSCDKVESELHARESDVRELREQLDRSEFHNHSLLRELCALRGMPGPAGVVEVPSEPWPVRSIALGRQTGGRAGDTCPADDALQVLVEPRDAECQAIKAPGTLLVEAQEVTPEGLKRSLSAWQVSPQELRCRWQNGLITTGYSLTFPWKVWPSTEKIRVIARFQLLDGRIFEADKDVTIRILPESTRKSLPPPGATMETTPPPTAIPFLPTRPIPVPSAPPEKPAPGKVLPPPLPSPTLPPPTPVETEGPQLLRGQTGPIKAELLRPIPLSPDP